MSEEAQPMEVEHSDTNMDTSNNDTKQTKRRFASQGIESQLKQFDIKVVDGEFVNLPTGWAVAPQAMHWGSPTIIVNADGVEMARWDGGRKEAKFFVTVKPGVYSAEDLAYMAAHVHCGHASCHEVKTREYVAALKRANKRRESVAKSRQKAKTKQTTGTKRKVAEEKEETEMKAKRQKQENQDADVSWVAELVNRLTHDKVPNPAVQLMDTLRRKDPEISQNVERRFECALMETIGHWDEKKQKELYDTTKTTAGDPTIAYCPTVGNRAVFEACGIEIVDDMRIKLPPIWTINHTKSFDEAHSGKYALGSGGYTYVTINEHGVATRTLTNIGTVDIDGDPETEENYRKLESLGMRRTKHGIMVPPGWHACYINGGARGADLYYPVYADRHQITKDNLRATIDEDGRLHIHDPKFVQTYQAMQKK